MNFASRNESDNQYYVDRLPMSNVIFYCEGKIVGQTDQGWVEAENEFGITNEKIYAFDQITEVRRATKENLDRKDCYYRKTGESEYGKKESKYTLYIYTGLLSSFVEAEECESSRYNGRIGYSNYFTLSYKSEGTTKSAWVRQVKQTRTVQDPTGVRADRMVELMQKQNRFTTFNYNDAMLILEDAETRQELARLLS
ncbi:hypothetical protein GD1_81 [Paraglaciecola Antarctic GD virus 1]|nr:hypothetical protein GD1_81 [Paraglaciecola Antarctic GD virus 1]